MVRKLQYELWWWVFNILHGSMEMLLHRLDTVGRGVKGRAVSETAGIWMKGGCSRVWSGGLCKGCGCRVRLVSVVGVFRM